MTANIVDVEKNKRGSIFNNLNIIRKSVKAYIVNKAITQATQHRVEVVIMTNNISELLSVLNNKRDELTTIIRNKITPPIPPQVQLPRRKPIPPLKHVIGSHPYRALPLTPLPTRPLYFVTSVTMKIVFTVTPKNG